MTHTPTSPATPELLLEHSGWIRRLARQLTGDANRAEDLEQATWLRMLTHPPSGDRPLRGWIATVMRNLLSHEQRGEVRRREREHRAARSESDESAQLVGQVALHRQLADAVLGLDEPYRSTIVLRYFEEMTPKRIAAELGIPVSTVKTRLARGLDKLRAQLDRDHGGNRQAWMAALIPLAQPPRGAVPLSWTVSLGALAVQTKIAIGAVAVAAVGTTLFVLSGGEPPATAEHRAAAPEPTTNSVVTAPPDSPRTVEASTRVAVPVPAAEPAVEDVTPGMTLVRGRVLDLEGNGVGGLGIAHTSGYGGEEGARTPALSDGSGHFTLETDMPGKMLEVVSDSWTTVTGARAMPADSGAEPILLAAPAIELAGQVVDEMGTAVQGARVALLPPQDLRQRLSLVMDHSEDQEWTTETDAEGRFDFENAPALRGGALTVDLARHVPVSEDAPLGSNDNLLLVLRRDRPAQVLAGRVVTPTGAPASEALVSFGFDSVRADTLGRFEFALDAEKTFTKQASEFFEVNTASLSALKAGYLPATLEAERDSDGEVAWPDDIVLRLGGEPLEIRGRVVDENGTPRAGIMVWLANPTFFGGLGDPAESRFPELAHVETLLADASPGWNRVLSAEDGSFTIGGLMDREYDVQAMDDDTLLRVEATGVRAGRSGVELVLSSEAVWPSLRGRVVNARGEGVPGVSIAPMCDSFRTKYQGLTIRTQHSSVEGTRTDEQGRFELKNVPNNLVYLRLDGTNTIPLEWGRHVEGGLAQLVGQDHDALEITVGQRCHFQVQLDNPTEADHIAALDAAGERLSLSEFTARGRRDGPTFALLEGRTPVLGVSDQATTLVLLREDEEVRRIPLRLTPGEQITVR